MTKRITITLTEDQYNKVFEVLEEKYWWNKTTEEEYGFIGRILSTLAQAKSV